MRLALISCFMFLSSLFHPAYSSSSIRPLCRIDESSALLQFKESFVVNSSTCGGPDDYPKVASWMLEGENSSCCLWDGVDCDDDTGHVIGLNLSSSCLCGSINSSSSLFRLIHLRQLDLSYNFFNYSQIPSTIGNLSMLTYLNLSYSFFQGQIPSEISLLYKLSVLDLSNNYNSYLQLLELKRPTLESLVQNLTNLEKLDLSVVDISSPVPNQLANISSLTALALCNCRLVGQFPIRILQLPNLQFLELWYNFDLKGYLPHLHLSSHLKYFSVGHTGFSGEIPASIGNLDSLERLDLGDCKFSGLIPPSLGNLSKLTILYLSGEYFREQTPSFFSNLSQLIELSISSYNMSRGSLSWLNQLNKINYLRLSKNNLREIPPSLANFTQLTGLDLSSNDFTSHIPFWVFNLTKLVHLDFSLNKLSGAISSSISQLENLEYLDLFSNNLSGTVELDMLLRLKNLTALCVSLNKLSLLPPKNSNATLQKFMILGLASCNLSEFPNFLQNQDRLGSLDLAFNNIRGQIPQWFWKTCTQNLIFLDLSHNFLTSSSQTLIVLPRSGLEFLDISSNKLQGSLPVPQSPIFFYSISKNELTGEISPLFCKLIFLEVLDLSENNLSGKIPKCLGNFSNSLTVLNLRRNNLHGTIPHTWTSGNKLRVIDVGDNKLRGQVPKSIVNCMLLENLDLGNNQINDSFPFWLATLPELKILILRSNYFHGPIAAPEFSLVFPKLRIFDISCNSITGSLPSKFFQSWNAMKIVDDGQLGYMQVKKFVFRVGSPGHFSDHYDYSMIMTNKHLTTQYYKIIEVLEIIDFSHNRFEGLIPESIGTLKGLRALNLSNNIFTGHIPTSLGHLTLLESLDLSHNKLLGEIPQQLVQLTFLASFDISYNNFTGSIPQGNQFDTFLNSSFEENLGLCGNPLSRKCEGSPPLAFKENPEYSRSSIEIDWTFVVIGYGSGFIIGLVIGHKMSARKLDWLVNSFGIRKQKWQRWKRWGRWK